MTLFGGPRRRRAGAGVAGSGCPGGGAGAGSTSRRSCPAFERRARLRDERHRLVSEVRRRDGTSHREINAWLNRALGIKSVDQATLDQLERSVEMLVGKLSGRKR